jgi:hypothetical protein
VTTSLEVRQIGSKDAYPFLLEIHYARRIPSISFAYGLFDNDELIGVCTYGTSASSTLAKGVCGPQWSKQVIELNRLCLLHNRKNEASILVGASLRMLPRPKIVVSYADTSQDHLGIVYQATNFYYTGLSAKFRDPKVKGLEHQHHATYAHGLSNKQVIEKFGEDNVYFVERPRKHRYVIFMASKTDKKQLLKDFRYPSLPYPQKAVQVS